MLTPGGLIVTRRTARAVGQRDAPVRCHFCGSKDVLLKGIGIAIDMGGDDYAFCAGCLRCNSACKFWYNLFDTLGCVFLGADEEVPKEPGEEHA
jgi:hypothetical protein